MFLVPLILQMFGKKQVKVNFSREEVAQHVRVGALKIVCNRVRLPDDAERSRLDRMHRLRQGDGRRRPHGSATRNSASQGSMKAAYMRARGP
jgi:hypothetical protein